MKAAFNYFVVAVFLCLLVMSFYTLFVELASVQENVRIILTK